jgi:hypothetical protein
MTEDLAVFEAAEAAARAGRAVVLATIVHCRGSVPAARGARCSWTPSAGSPAPWAAGAARRR